MKLAMPDKACVGISVEGAQTGSKTHYDGRIVDVENRRHQKALRDLGAFPVNLGGRAEGGYRCVCGFRGYFATCSKCGAACEKET